MTNRAQGWAALWGLMALALLGPSARAEFSDKPDDDDETAVSANSPRDRWVPAKVTFTPEIMPADGETNSLYPGGPLVHREGSKLCMSLGPQWSNGRSCGTYREDSTLHEVSTWNGQGHLVEQIEYNLGRPGVMETRTDPRGTGHFTNFRRLQPSAAKPGQTDVVEEELTAAGSRRETGRWTYGSSQAFEGGTVHCVTGAEPITLAGEVAATTVNDMVAGQQGAVNCSAAGAGITMTGYAMTGEDTRSTTETTVTPTFKGVPGSPLCIDAACKFDPEKTAKDFQDTIREGARCLAKLGTQQIQGAAAQKAAAGNLKAAAIDMEKNGYAHATNADFLRNNQALRMSAQMMMLMNQSQNMSSLFNGASQNFAPATEALASQSVAQRAAAAWKAKPISPIRISCGGGLWPGSVKLAQNGAANQTMKVDLGALTPASATVPGAAGWPTVMLSSGVSGSSVIGSKGVIFHELMHLLGIPHNDGTAIATGGAVMPLHTACASCCFGDYNSNPGCKGDNMGNNRQTMCDVCAGKYGTDRASAQAFVDGKTKVHSAGGEAYSAKDAYTSAAKNCGTYNRNVW